MELCYLYFYQLSLLLLLLHLSQYNRMYNAMYHVWWKSLGALEVVGGMEENEVGYVEDVSIMAICGAELRRD